MSGNREKRKIRRDCCGSGGVDDRQDMSRAGRLCGLALANGGCATDGVWSIEAGGQRMALRSAGHARAILPNAGRMLVRDISGAAERVEG